MRKLSISGRASAWRAGGTRFRARWTATSGIGSPSTTAATPLASRVASAPGAGVAGGGVWPRKKAADRRLMIAAASHGFRTLRMELLLVPESGSLAESGEANEMGKGSWVARLPCRKNGRRIVTRSPVRAERKWRQYRSLKLKRMKLFDHGVNRQNA